MELGGDAPDSASPEWEVATKGRTRLQNHHLPKNKTNQVNQINKINQKNLNLNNKLIQNQSRKVKQNQKERRIKNGRGKRVTKINILHFNCRGLATEERLYQFEKNLENVKWDIVGLGEVRRKGEKLMTRKNGNYWYYFGESKGYRGIGFYIKGYWKNKIIEMKGITERVGYIKLQIEKGVKLLVVQVYAPTAGAEEDEIKKFYNDLSTVLQREREYYTIIMGDFNAKIGGGKTKDNTIGKFGLGERNKRGKELIEFAYRNNLKIANTFFQKRKGRKWTWKSPDQRTINEIDHLLINDIKIIKDVDIVIGMDCLSDHRMVRGKLEIQRRSLIRNHKRERKNLKQIIPKSVKSKAEIELLQQVNITKENIKVMGVQAAYNELENEIKYVVKKYGTKRKEETTRDKISEETSKLIMKKRVMWKKARGKMNDLQRKIENIEMQKMIKKRIREDVRKFNDEKIRQIIEESRSTKKVKKELSEGRNMIVKLKKEDGEIEYNREGIVELATKFYEKLYQKGIGEEYTNYEQYDESKDDTPEFIREEIRNEIKRLKKNKISGPDKIDNDLIRSLQEAVIPMLTLIFNEIIRTKVIPKQWTLAELILIYKKGVKEDIGNYRPISLTSSISKIFMACIKNRVYWKLDENQGREQTGFRRGYSTIDNLFIINQLIEKANEYDLNMQLMFIDYNKAFDMVNHDYLWGALKKQGVEIKIIEVIKTLYEQTTAYIKLDKKGREFKIGRGVRQGDPLSPNLFNSVLEEIFRKMNWQEMGIKINGEWINNIRFADDVVIIAKDTEELKKMSEELIRESRKAGLTINSKKTKIMKRLGGGKLELEGVTIEKVKEIVYLGQLISFKNKGGKEISRRIKGAWYNFWALKAVYKGKIDIKLKNKILESATLPTLTYGAQTWATTKYQMERIKATQREMERKICGVSKLQKITNEEIRKRTGARDISEITRKLKWRYAGHLARLQKDTWAKKVLEWYPVGEKRRRGRPARRWRDELVGEAGITWQRKARNRREWEADGEAYVQVGLQQVRPP